MITRLSFLLLLALGFSTVEAKAQVAINTDGSEPNTSAMLDVSSTEKGLLIPTMTSAQRTGINSPANGLLVYDTDTRSFWYYNSSVFEWQKLGNDVAGATEINELTDGRTNSKSVFLGSFAGLNDDGTDNKNTALGYDALKMNISGEHNAAVGQSALRNNTGNGNAAIGSMAMNDNTTGTSNVAIGRAAMYSNTQGNFNVGIGMNSNFFNQQGSQNTIIGQGAGMGSSAHDKSGNIFLGYKAGYFETGSNKLYIDNSDTAKPLIGGDFSANEVYLNSMVGIGTSSLLETLHIAEDNGTTDGSDGSFALIQNTNASFNVLSGIRFKNGTATNTSKGGIFYRDMSSYGRGDIVFVNNSVGLTGNATFADTRMIIKNDGDVGIGTTDPNELLEVAHPTNDYGRMIVSDGGGLSRNALLFVSPKASTQTARIEAFDYGNSTGLTLKFNTIGDGDCVFGGNVGIKTTSPLSALHVHGDGHNNMVYVTPATTSDGDSSSIFLAEDHDASFGMYWMYDGDGNEMELWGKNSSTTYGPHMLIHRNTGDMAIGGENFATGYKLSVEGKIICEELRVSFQGVWPDYVFNDDYKLLPIDCFRKYINENGHLPNIPPAAEVKASGLSVGEMQRLLLEKVEELSLYILNQEERITELEDKLSKTMK